ncbi:hypothetical protein EsH8_VII_000102 [Colletotrichum jinshuiense]
MPHLQRSNNKDRMHLLQNRLLVLLPNRLPLVTLFLDHINESYIVPNLGQGGSKIKYWSNHGAMHLHVFPSELKAGFITNLYALQRRKNTYFTGGAWTAQFSTILWEYNNQCILPKLLAEF